MNELSTTDFAAFCQAIHGYEPFPWQRRLVERVVDSGWPELIDVPTGLGKTGVLDVAVFTAALHAADNAIQLPEARRRVFFIVDRRLVVDEAYEHARAISVALGRALADDPGSLLGRIAAALHLKDDRDENGEKPVVDVTRMRGGTSWSWRWLERPDRHAIVVGTVDQVGSRVFFRGYGLGPNLRPIDAALTGTDSLIIVDEAHLSQPFLASLHAAMGEDKTPGEVRPVLVQMTASPQVADQRTHGITDEDLKDPVAAGRLHAPKRLHTAQVHASKKTAGDAIPAVMAQWAEHLAADAGVVAVICNTVARARAVFKLLSDHHPGECVLLTGRIRPVDRDYLLREWYGKIKAGRVRGSVEEVFLIATQTVEVGANIDVDALVSDSAPMSSLIQRLGRLNRFGSFSRDGAQADTHAVIVHSDDDHPGVYGEARVATWRLLTEMIPPMGCRPGHHLPSLTSGLPASPRALGTLLQRLSSEERGRLSPPGSYIPVMFASHLDTWTQTSPTPRTDVPVGLFLHGIESGPPDVSVVWRELPEGEKDRKLAVLTLPPSADEVIEVPAAAVRAWLSGTHITVSVDDLEGGHADNTPPDSAPRRDVRVIRYQDRDKAEPISVDKIKPGDLIVVPVSLGGCDKYGWNPASTAPVTDVADLASNAGRRVTIRFGPTLLRAVAEHDSEFAGKLRTVIDQVAQHQADDELRDADYYRTEIGRICPGRATENDPPHLAVLTRLARSKKPVLDEHAALGWVTLTSNSAAFGDDTDSQASSVAPEPIALMDHQRAVQRQAEEFARNLGCADTDVMAIGLAALWHDEGKRDRRFQIMLHGGDRIAADIADEPRAKSGLSPVDRAAFTRAWRMSGYPAGMRHEALSVQIANHLLKTYPDVDGDLVLHLIASHHGRSRPLLPPVSDRSPVNSVRLNDAGELPVDTNRSIDWTAPARFARLNEQYGRWGLARLEAILRLADIWCSARGESDYEGPAHRPARPGSRTAAARESRLVELPALDGRNPLGFLAALGLTRVVNTVADIPARLAFSQQSGCAVLESRLASPEEISQVLAQVVADIPPAAIIPQMSPGFPPVASIGKDPLRPVRSEYPALITALSALDPETVRTWLPCLVTDLATDKQGRADLTPLTAPSGQQKIRTFFKKPFQAVSTSPSHLHEALTSWRRTEGFTGEYLDHRVLRSAADDSEGRTGQESGVPGATWLATMSLPLLRHTGDGTWPKSVLWYRSDRGQVMRWPLWHNSLDLHAIKCLLDHPELQAALRSSTTDLTPLGVFAICSAERQRIPGRNFAGVLAPATLSAR